MVCGCLDACADFLESLSPAELLYLTAHNEDIRPLITDMLSDDMMEVLQAGNKVPLACFEANLSKLDDTHCARLSQDTFPQLK
jgi:hypothetical protein